MRKALSVSAALFLSLLIAGCASLGVPAADTFNKRAIVANGLVSQASATVETLSVAGKLSKPDATAYNRRAADAGEAIDIARQVHTSDPADGDARLSAIITGLNILVAELETRK